MTTVEAIFAGYLAQVAATATISALSTGFKKLNDRTANGRVEMANFAITAAIDVIRRGGQEIDPIAKKRLATRIEELKVMRDTLPKKIGKLEWRRKKEYSEKTRKLLQQCLVVYDDALELSDSSSLNIWKDVDTQIPSTSSENLTQAIPIEEPTTPRASYIPSGSGSIPLNDEPTTPRISDTPVCGFPKGAATSPFTPAHRTTPTPPPSPSPSTEPLFNTPPAAAKLGWSLKNPFVEKSKQKMNLYLELNETGLEGRS